MRSGLDVSCELDPAEVTGLVRGVPWLDRDGRSASRFEVLDIGDLDQVRLLLVQPAGRPDVRYFFPAVPTDSGRLTHAGGAAAFHDLVTEAIRSARRVHTARGATIEFRGVPKHFVRQLPFDPGWSSNTLSLLDLDGTPSVHKTYRRLSTGVTEPAVLRSMTRSGLTARYLGEYTYLTEGQRWPLGVLYEYVPGDGIDTPLLANLRSVWSRTDVPDHVRPLVDLLRDAGRFIRRFHDALAGHFAGSVPVPMRIGPVADELRERLARLAPRILDDTRFPTGVRRAAMTGIRQAVRAATRDAGAADPCPGGPCHGDLHLAHVLVPGSGMRAIDLSTPAIDPALAAFTRQSPLQDLVSLRRAIEYLTWDTAIREAARRSGRDELELCLSTVAARSGLGRVGAAADGWRAQVLHQVRLGYADGRPAPDRHPGARLLYLRRLLHELEYNYTHDRPYYLAIDLRYAIAAAGR